MFDKIIFLIERFPRQNGKFYFYWTLVFSDCCFESARTLGISRSLTTTFDFANDHLQKNKNYSQLLEN